MNIAAVLLFTITFLAGIITLRTPKLSKKNFSNVLSFSGAYLFSITVVHLLPELFHTAGNPFLSGVLVLLGFYLQLLIGFFSSGIEHGHLHKHSDENHTHHTRLLMGMYLSIWIHAFMEGTLLVHPHAVHNEAGTHNLLIGLLLHKIPESIALTAMMLVSLQQIVVSLFLLIVYALSSPLGLLAGQYISHDHHLPELFFPLLFALIAGNFLHISTVIYFETEPSGHKFKGTKVFITGLAAIVAILVEMLQR